MKDSIYIFNKSTKEKIYLGEIQTNFNFSLTLDKTNDSTKVNVYSFELNDEVEPNTIVWHENTNSWWIIKSDRVERRLNENGFYYLHEIELVGAIELLNARDLTDCGFNQGRYTIGEVIQRLFDLSNFEYTLTFEPNVNVALRLNQTVDYIKTYQNYTLLSALRDFLDGYNCECKLEFAFNLDETQIAYCVLYIISKTGTQAPIKRENVFNDIREIKTMSKNTFGTIVVSNAENVVSTKAKLFPSVGGAKLSAVEYNIKGDTAVLRLPSKVYQANWLKLTYKIRVRVQIPNTYDEWLRTLNPYDNNDVKTFFNYIKSRIHTYADPNYEELYYEQLALNEEKIRNAIKSAATITLYEGNKVDPTYNNGAGKIVKGDNVPYLPRVYKGILGVPTETIDLVLVDKDTRDTLPKKYCGVYWERGSNLIRGFDFLTDFHYLVSFNYTDLQNSSYSWSYNPTANSSDELLIRITYEGYNDSDYFKVDTVNCILNYIPMSDIKIKIDNQRDKQDIQLYNQNGKITDSHALSKLLNSYSKEISSDTITKYSVCYNYADVFKLGQRVLIKNTIYIINNVSIDFYQNENGYYLECEYTLSKQFAVKSMMVSPNTNIRDYGIPQNFNVERKQTYRDYYEFDYTADSNADNNPYCKITETLHFDNIPKELCSYVGVIKCEYEEQIGSENNKSFYWYYQLETTKYELDKMIYVVMTFNDNNIIGYGSQNVYSGFDITRVFTNWIDTINTPISYVDDYGEVKGISIMFCDNETLTQIYDDFKIDTGHGSSDKSIYNFSCFIDEYIYDEAYAKAQMKIIEENYKKDALEVPVFEYAVQIDDSENVFIGDNILREIVDDDIIYFYGFKIGNAFSMTTQNAFFSPNIVYPTSDIVVFDNSCDISLDTSNGNKLNIALFIYKQYEETNGIFLNSSASDENIKNKDLAVFRVGFRISNHTVVSNDLLFIAQNVDPSCVNSNVLTLYINQYTLK